MSLLIRNILDYCFGGCCLNIDKATQETKKMQVSWHGSPNNNDNMWVWATDPLYEGRGGQGRAG